MNNVKAFTLIEVVLTISLFAIISLIPFVLDSGLVSSLQSESSADQVFQSFRKAQLKAMMSHQNSPWGVKIQNNSIVLFKGSSYSSREVEYDDTIYIDNKTSVYSIEGGDEIIFESVSGIPEGEITIRIVNNMNNKFIDLSINSVGGISYE